jgi:glycosyltransferase involved in cell wall biosynthesis
MPPKISVITPSFNQGKYLERTILSVIRQNYPSYELIIVDGGSTDETAGILTKYKEQIHTCIREPDKGQSQAINKGLKIANGELLAFQNSDDIYLDGAFHKIARAFSAHPNCGVFSGNIKLIDESDRVLNTITLIKPRLLAQIFNGPQLHNQAAFWTRDTMKRVGYLDENLHFCMDYEYFLRILNEHIGFCHVNEFIGAFRIHPGSKTANKQDMHLSELNRIREKARSELGISKYVPRGAMALANKIYKAAIHIKRGELGYLFRSKKNIFPHPKLNLNGGKCK